MTKQSSNKSLEAKQINHIKTCLPTLIQLTKLSPLTIAILLRHGVLGTEDESALKAILNEHERNREFYKIIQTRVDFYEALMEAMEQTNQTKVLKLLKDLSVNNESAHPPIIYSTETSWDDIPNEHKVCIRSRLSKKFKMNFQEQLDKLLHGDALAQVINDEHFEPFKKTIPETLEYYISRKIITRNRISEGIFRTQTSNTFVFAGMSRSELSKFTKNDRRRSGSTREQLMLDTLELKFMIEDRQGQFERLCDKIKKHPQSASESIHLICQDASKKLRWIKSVGEMDVVQKYIDKAQDTLSEETFIANLSTDSNMPICISDSPGMGKSVLLGNIARKLDNMFPDRSIFVVSMVHLMRKITINKKEGSFPFAKALEDMVCQCDLARDIFKLKLGTGNKISIELLLDGFDELETADYQSARIMIQTIMSSFKSIRLWVTSRPHFIAELENTLQTLGYNIQAFSDNDQIEFLTKYWGRSEMDIKKMHRFACTCLEKIKSSYSSTDKDIAGIPLQCRLIGEVYEKQAIEYGCQGKNICLEETFEVTSITHLFKQTIKNRFKKYQDMNQEQKLTWEEIMHLHAGWSLDFLFPEHFNKYLKTLFSNQLHAEDKLKVGILEAPSATESPRFVHRTFAEYFAAWFLVSKLKGEGTYWRRFFLKSYSVFEDLLGTDKTDVFQAITDFLFVDVLGCKDITVEISVGSFSKPARKITSYKFANPVITYFLNFLLANENLETIASRFTCYFKRQNFSSGTLRRLTQSCINADLLHIFKFLSALDLFGHPARPDSVFDRNLLFLAVRHSSLMFVQEIIAQYEKQHIFDVSAQMDVLYLAVARGDYSILELFLIEKNLDVLVGTAKLLLHSCIAFTKNNSADDITQRIEICKTLLHESKSLLEEKDEFQRTPLLRPDVHVRLLITLVELEADVTVTDIAGDTLLHLNYTGGRQMCNQDYQSLLTCIPKNMLKRLVSVKGADRDVPLVRLLKQIDVSPGILEKFRSVDFNFNSVAEDDYSILARAIKSGRSADTLKLLISFGSSIHWKMGRRTLLHIAVESGNVDAITVLMELKNDDLDVNFQDENGSTPLDYAVQNSQCCNRLKIGMVLWEHGAKYNDRDDNTGRSWLHISAEMADCDSVKLLIHFGKSPNCLDNSGNTPLHFAVVEYGNKQNSMYEISKLLLENQADPSLINSDGNTPFYLALKNHNLDIETYNLLKPKTHEIWPQKFATLALMFAIRAADSLERDEFHTLIQEGLENGGDVNCNYYGDTALHTAVDKQDEGVVTLLVQNNADTNVKNIRQQTPLHKAALCSDKDFACKIMKYLILHGANDQLKDRENRTILQIFELGDVKPSCSQLDFVAGLFSQDSSSGQKYYSKAKIGDLLLPKEEVIPYLLPTGAEKTPTHAQSPKNREFMVGQDCSIPGVVHVLLKVESTLSDRWSAIGRELGITISQIKGLKQDLVLNKITLDELMVELLEMWVAMQGRAATLKHLIYVLEKNGMGDAAGRTVCSFPSHWIGKWFQSGVHNAITISHSAINIKGKCLEVEGEKYLVYDAPSECYKCLVFSEKHTNVLQYKESYCIQSRNSLPSLPSICSTISGDANLYAMFRLDADPIDCPLQGPFTFSYDRGYGECRYPESSLDSCTLTSRLLFNYQACPDVPKTESVEEELQCLAAWKEGSYRYFLGLIQYRHHGSSSNEDRFRCYAYEMLSGGGSSSNGNNRRGELHHNSHHHHQQHPQTMALGRSRPKPYQGVTMMNGFNSTGGKSNNFVGRPHSLTSGNEIIYRVEQSGDATCNGLSTMEGSRTMYLRKAQEPKTEKCRFPSWVQTHTEWLSLDQSSSYEFDGEGFKVTSYSSEPLLNEYGQDSLEMRGSCLQLLNQESGYSAKLIVHARAGCKLGYKCMVLHKRDADILEVQFGEWSRKHEEACDSDAYFDPYRQPYITLISSTPKNAQCPTIGEFSLRLSWEQGMRMRTSHTSNFHEGLCTTNGTLRMGCSSLDFLQLEVSSQCHDHNLRQHPSPAHATNSEVTDYNCHGWWEEDGITYMIATLSSSPKVRAKRRCFVIRDSTSQPIQSSRLKQTPEGQQMSFRQHSNSAAGQHVGGGSEAPYGNSHREMVGSEAPSSSAALFFFNNNDNHGAVGRILEISTFADSCRRNVVVGEEGNFAFNATKIGHCFASSSSPSVIIRGGSLKGYGGGRRMVMVMIREIMTSVKVMPQHWMETPVWILSIAVLLLR